MELLNDRSQLLQSQQISHSRLHSKSNYGTSQISSKNNDLHQLLLQYCCLVSWKVPLNSTKSSSPTCCSFNTHIEMEILRSMQPYNLGGLSDHPLAASTGCIRLSWWYPDDSCVLETANLHQSLPWSNVNVNQNRHPLLLKLDQTVTHWVGKRHVGQELLHAGLGTKKGSHRVQRGWRTSTSVLWRHCSRLDTSISSLP